MLREMLASIRSFLARLPRLVMTKVWDGMRWIQRLVAVPALPPEPAPVAQDNRAEMAAEDVRHMEALRAVAAHLAAGSIPKETDLDAIREEDLSWLTAMQRPMLCRIVSASDDALRAHIRRTTNLKGVLLHDPKAVADYRTATRRKREDHERAAGPDQIPAMA